MLIRIEEIDECSVVSRQNNTKLLIELMKKMFEKMWKVGAEAKIAVFFAKIQQAILFMCAQFKRKKFKSAQIAIEQTAHILKLKVKQKIHILKEKEIV